MVPKGCLPLLASLLLGIAVGVVTALRGSPALGLPVGVGTFLWCGFRPIVNARIGAS